MDSGKSFLEMLERENLNKTFVQRPFLSVPFSFPKWLLLSVRLKLEKC